jgi:DNA primase
MSKVIPKNVLEEIRSANDIVEVVGSYLQLKRGGSAHKALCPFHKEKTPSFNVNAQRQIYHCFGCGAGGDVFKFVMEYESVDFSTAARMLAERGGIRLEWADTDESGGPAKDSLLKIHEEVALVFHRALLETPGAERARLYLKDRELDEKTVKDFLIGYAPEGRDVLLRWCRKKKYSVDLFIAAGLIMKSEQGDVYDRFRNRLMFPIRDELGWPSTSTARRRRFSRRAACSTRWIRRSATSSMRKPQSCAKDRLTSSAAIWPGSTRRSRRRAQR